MPEFETIKVHSRHVSCDGGKGASGHPKVFLHIKGHDITCPYCSKTFVLEGDGVEAAH
jgi:uncharacterized Zn-finger protein